MYSLFELLQAYKNNKYIIHAYINKHKIENYEDDNHHHSDNYKNSDNSIILGMTIGTFLILLLLSMALWVWAIIILIKYWNILPIWAQIIGIIGLLSGFGPILTIIVVYIGKNVKK